MVELVTSDSKSFPARMLRPPFLWDRKLYGDLCRCTYAATKTFFARQFPELDDAVPAMVVAPQSFGNLANFHPHAHALTALGVFTRDGVFHPAPEDLDFNPVEELFREGLFKVLLKKEKITEERVELLKSWEHSGFRVHADRRVAAGERQELEALLQYFERPPVSLERLEYHDDGRVLYRGTRFHPGLGRDHQLSSGVEFLAMLVPHIALRHECRIHLPSRRGVPIGYALAFDPWPHRLLAGNPKHGIQRDLKMVGVRRFELPASTSRKAFFHCTRGLQSATKYACIPCLINIL